LLFWRVPLDPLAFGIGATLVAGGLRRLGAAASGAGRAGLKDINRRRNITRFTGCRSSRAQRAADHTATAGLVAGADPRHRIVARRQLRPRANPAIPDGGLTARNLVEIFVENFTGLVQGVIEECRSSTRRLRRYVRLHPGQQSHRATTGIHAADEQRQQHARPSCVTSCIAYNYYRLSRRTASAT